ncbi:hypothetical protein PC116_g22967 [Phytophthora cactorum]|uniref:Uncharacterized protein n=5 Tax=Phytophthora cactorum TaxID=29920 RepID=A0A8T1BVM6_9STRA|nr:hypothetical protein PC112_g18836 [Phytophthora cactorum]KAG2804997.1 hypothetical protein PC111_g18020 [Phytophthora cactorum]KAG2841980.1 hypothetical protein PC113_g18928 [Phytophthora cactorum]KAG2883138.1 hypothetical protein PC114_g20720 [Phytophthora cactorum]KAG2893624.1 hypothetical protein PC115_g18420 [Phytophthora cactorum]
MGGGLAGNIGGFGQQMGPGMQGGNTFGGFGGQGAMGSVGQAGNNWFAGAGGGQLGFGGAALGGGNSLVAPMRERQRRR